MTHLTEHDLVLHYYGEPSAATDAESHLRACTRCSAEYAALEAVLARVNLPEFEDPGAPFWENVQRNVLARVSAERRNRQRAALIWLLPLVYPFATPAIFYSAQFGRAHGVAVGVPLVLLTLAWSLAGPFVALFVLGRLEGSGGRGITQRAIVYGAFLSTISASLFNFVITRGLGLAGWYGVLLAAAALTLIPIRAADSPSPGLRRAHRWSALLIVVFGVAHILNHATAIVSVATHSAILDLLRLVYRAPVLEAVLFAVITFQIGSGASLLWRTHRSDRSTIRNVQAVSGIYLAFFFVVHISAALLARPETNTDFVWAAGQNGLLASQRSTLLFPYYLLGVMAFLSHVGAALTRRYAGSLTAAVGQRLSYAGVAFGGAVVVTVALALCGVHLVP